MKAIVLAAGEGTRLRPLTLAKPKCLVPLGGKPLLEQQLATLASCNINDITVVTGAHAQEIERMNLNTVHNEHYAKTGMVYSLMCAQSVFPTNEPLIIAYGDIVYETKVLQALIETPGDLVTCIDLNWKNLWELRMSNPLDDAETLKLNDQFEILELGKKASRYEDVQGQYMGLIKVGHRFVQNFINHYHALPSDAIYDGKDKDNMYMTSFLQSFIDQHYLLKAATTQGGWLEVDTNEDLQTYEKLLQAGKLAEFYQMPPC